MSPFDVHPHEMLTRQAHDQAITEAFLTGTIGDGPEHEALAEFAAELKAVAQGPVPAARPDLALLMSDGISAEMPIEQGISAEKGDLPATAASNVTGPASQAAGLPKWRKKKMLVPELLTGLAAKLAGLGVAAKVGLGLGVAAASVTGAGAAGVLPDPAQHAVADVVGVVTPFELDDTVDDVADDPDELADDVTDDLTDDLDEVGDDVIGGDEGTDDGEGDGTDDKVHPENFGAIVSADATGESDGTPGVDGQVISELAKAQSGNHDDEGAPGKRGEDHGNQGGDDGSDDEIVDDDDDGTDGEGTDGEGGEPTTAELGNGHGRP